MKGKQQTYSYFFPQENKERQKVNFQDEPSCQVGENFFAVTFAAVSELQ